MKTFRPYFDAALAAIALIICFSSAQAADADKKPLLRVAVLDLQAPQASPWLGPAVSESLVAKLGGVDGVTLIEREQVQAILLAKQDQEPTPELLGADFLITGSVQLVGTWPDEAAQIRLTTTVVAAVTAKLNADAATVLDGTVGKLFALESDLAEQLARSMGLEPTRLQIDYHEERSTKAKQLLGEGLFALQQAEALIQEPQLLRNRLAAAGEEGAATVVPVGKDEMASADAGQTAEPLLRSSIQLFRQAQQANECAFFARAHHYETRARELLAKVQQDNDRRRQVREETIKQFRQDAADAAPAFFDLGRALQANGQHEQAIEAYQSFLQWFDEKERPFLWEDRWHHPIMTETGPGYFDHGLRRYEQSLGGANNWADITRSFTINDGQLFYCDTTETLCCAELDSGRKLWKTTIKKSGRWKAGCMYALVVREKHVYFASNDWVQVFNRATGAEIRRFPSRQDSIDWKDDGDWHIEEDRGSYATGPLEMFVLEDQDVLVLRDTHGWSGHCISSGKRLWTNTRRAWYSHALIGNSLYNSSSGMNYLRVLDPLSGIITELEHVPSAAQIWPGRDHLLLRQTKDRRRPQDDLYFRFNPSTSASVRVEQPLFFSPFHVRMPDDLEQTAVPLMDEATGRYRLIPARFLYPLNQVPKMDRFGGPGVIREMLPWVTLEGDNLWVWESKTARQIDVSTGELKWKKWIPDSCSGIDGKGDLAVVRLGNRFGVYRAGHSAFLSLPVRAHERIAQCQLVMKRHNEASQSLRSALELDAVDPSANFAMSDLQRLQGNVIEAVEYAERLLRTAPPSHELRQSLLKWLRSRTGLVAQVFAPDYEIFGSQGNHIYLRKQAGGRMQIERLESPGFAAAQPVLSVPAQECWLREDGLHVLEAGCRFVRGDRDTLGSYDGPSGRGSCSTPDPNEDDSVLHRYNCITGAREELVRFRDFHPCFMGDDGLLCGDFFLTGLRGRRLVAFDLLSGERIWERQLGPGGWDLLCKETRVFLAQSSSPRQPLHEILCLDLKTGGTLWARDLDVTLRPGVHRKRRDDPETTWTQNLSVPDVKAQLLSVDAFRNQLCIVPVYYREAKTGLYYWSDPRPPLFRLDLETGKLLGRVEIDDRTTYLGTSDGRNYIGGWQWTWAVGKLPHVRRVLDEYAYPQGDTPTDFSVAVADFWETDPRRLAEFPPLADLKDEWDLSVHVARLNEIIASPDKRRALIESYRQPLLKRRGGMEPAICRVQYLLGKENLTDLEEQFLTRQIMTLWKGHEPYTHLRLFHYPPAVRGVSPVFPEPSAGEHQRVIGEVDEMFMVQDHKDNNRQLNPLRWQPHLDVSDVNHVKHYQGYLFVSTSDGFLSIYDVRQFMRFLTEIVQQDRGAFAIAQAKLPIGNAFDGDPETVCTAEPEDEPVVIGFDFAYPRAVNRITLTPAPGAEQHLVGAMLQASDRSETGGFRVLHLIREAPKPGEKLTIQLEKPETARWFRLVVPAGQPLAVADLAFEYDAPTYDGVEEADAAPPPQPGLKRTVFHGTWDNLPDFVKLKPAENGVARSITLDGVEPKDNFGLCFDGWIRITTPGEYAFHLTSDDGSRLLLHSAAQIDNDGLHGMVEKSAIVKLTPGLHPIRIEFFENGGGEGLQLEWTTPDSGRGPVPADVLLHRQEVPVSP